jgi:polysaccharide biosynthesis protein PslG
VPVIPGTGTLRPSNGTNRKRGKLSKEPVNRLKFIGGIALSLTLVGGLVLSLLSGGGTTRTPTATKTHAATAGARSEFFGITQGIRLDGPDLQTMAATGVGEDRIQLIWGSAQPTRGSFNWGPTDKLIGALASYGIRAVPFVWGSARWVTNTPAHPPIDSAPDAQAWQEFLQAAVVRYGRGGSYWANVYRQRYGADAKPLPIQSWQIWNEPNLKKFFAPRPSVGQYARLLQISRNAIKKTDPQAQIVLAGMPSYGGIRAWDFLDSLYSVPGIKGDFDAVALHPYARGLDQIRLGIEKVREVMRDHGDQDTPLWLTELGAGSAPPDRFGLNKGLSGQKRLLSDSFKLILRHRNAWNVQRVFWFDWRDPGNSEAVACSFCASAGLLSHNRSPKPAYHAFKRFAKAR